MSHTRRTILIVDDSPEDRELYRRLLQKDTTCSYTILEASTGKLGLLLWHQHQPDILLLDYWLPDLDGLAFLNQLQSPTPQPCFPIIMLTGLGNETIAVRAMKAGAQDYLVKGQITSDGLQFAIHNAIETARLQAELHQRIERERVVFQITRQIHRSLDLDEILTTAVREVRAFLQTDRVVVFQILAEGWGKVVTESVDPPWLPLLSTTLHDPCFNENYVELFKQGFVTIKNDIYDGSIEPCHVELLASLQVRANLVVPILQEDQLWGMLIAHHCTAPRQWKLLEVELLKELATQLGVALKQAQFYQQAQQELAERKRTEAALQENKQLLQFALTGTQAGLWDWELQRNKITWSPENYDLYGFDPASGSPQYDDWYSVIHPEDREQTSREVTRVIAERRSDFRSEFRIVHPERGIRWLLGLGRLTFNDQGEPVRLSGINLDITDRKQAEEALRYSEERYRYLVEINPQIVWIANAEGRNTYMNQYASDYFGMPGDQVLDLNWQNVIYPEDAEQVLHLWMESVQNGTPYEAEYRIRRSDGVYRWHLVRGIPLRRDEQGQVLQWFGVSIDIHDKQELEQQRSQLLRQEQIARAEAEQANRIKDEFLAILSHELRSPLNPILGWTKLMQHKNFDVSKTSEALATIERNVKLQTQLIDDLLDIAKILRGKLSIKAAPVNLVSVIEAAIETVRTAAMAKSIELNIAIPPIGQITGDAARIQQIVWNLLSNAIKFTPVGGRVDIELSLVAAHGSGVDDQTPTPYAPHCSISQYAQVTVKDTGKGIRPDFLPHIFESFRQEDASTTRRYGGLGLGLAIVRSLVEAHGGTIVADSPGEGQGATFVVQFPLLTPESEGNPSDERGAQIANLTGIRILVIDDDPDSLELLNVVLVQYGATVLTATSAAKALSFFETFQPDLLVSDVGMPEMDGYTLLQKIRTLPSHQGNQVPAIALTAYATDRDRELASAAGFGAHLAKPVDPQRLVAAIAELLQEPLAKSHEFSQPS